MITIKKYRYFYEVCRDSKKHNFCWMRFKVNFIYIGWEGENKDYLKREKERLGWNVLEELLSDLIHQWERFFNSPTPQSSFVLVGWPYFPVEFYADYSWEKTYLDWSFWLTVQQVYLVARSPTRGRTLSHVVSPGPTVLPDPTWSIWGLMWGFNLVHTW